MPNKLTYYILGTFLPLYLLIFMGLFSIYGIFKAIFLLFLTSTTLRFTLASGIITERRKSKTLD